MHFVALAQSIADHLVDDVKGLELRFAQMCHRMGYQFAAECCRLNTRERRHIEIVAACKQAESSVAREPFNLSYMSRLGICHVHAMHDARLRIAHHLNFSLDTQEQAALTDHLGGFLMHLDQFGVVEVEIDIEVVVDHEVGADGVEHYCLGEVFNTEVGDGLFGRLLVHVFS